MSSEQNSNLTADVFEDVNLPEHDLAKRLAEAGDDTEAVIAAALDALDSDGLYVLEAEAVEEYLSRLARKHKRVWKRLKRRVRNHCNGNADLPRVGEVDEWSAEIEAAASQATVANKGEVSFRIGDAAEISKKLEREARDGQPLVFDQGALHRYNPDTGLWQNLPEHELSQIVQEYSGAPVFYDPEKKPTKLKISGTAKRDAVELLHDRHTRPGFFDEAPDGLMLQDTFLRVVDNDLHEETPSQEHRARVGVNVPYQPDAEAPLFDEYLRSIFEGDEDAEAKRQLLLEFCGVCLLGKPTKFERALVLYDATDRSAGANGKSVLIKLLGRIFENHSATSATASVSPQDFGNRFRLATLAGARINYVAELPEGDIIAGGNLKGIITGDALTVEHKYQDPFDFYPRAGHIFAANDLPRVAATDDAFWRRWLVLPFSNRFTPPGEPGADRIRGLEDKIAADELPGVVAGMVDAGRRVLRRNGYTVPPSVDAAKDYWRYQSNPIQQFLVEETTNYTPKGPQYDTSADDSWWREADKYTTSSDLYRAYKAWTEKTGHRAASSTLFGRRIKKLVEKRTSGTARYRVRLKDKSKRAEGSMGADWSV